MKEKYDILACCVCREQHSVDAYTLWGGYYSGGYYPSKRNMLCPASTRENQIDVPVFRMLGVDPMYCYDGAKYNKNISRGPLTLEPFSAHGKNEKIVSVRVIIAASDTAGESPIQNDKKRVVGMCSFFANKSFSFDDFTQIHSITSVSYFIKTI
jgi:hypothetical protein